MSAGSFVRSRYLMDSGSICPIRVQPETLELVINGGTNSAPGTQPDVPASASVGRGKRTNGINARLVRIVFSGTPPSGYKPNSPIALPWVNGADTFALLAAGQTGTYLGTAITLVGKTPEYVR